MPDELVDIVDLEGRIKGSELKNTAHERKLIHPIVRIILMKPLGDAYLQQRASDKEFYPNKWEGSMAEHVHKGEPYVDAALRGVQEEFEKTLDKESFLEVGRFAITDSTHPCYNILYVVKNVIWKPTVSSEAQAGAWVPLSKISEEINEIPEKYTPGFIATWNVFCKNKFSKHF